MFTVVVQMQVRAGKRADFLAGMAENAASSVRDEPGCQRFDVCSVDGDDHRFVLYEHYTDAAAFDAHRAAPHFQRWRETAGQVLVPGSQVTTTGTVLVSHAAELPA
jgi:(4S)-4-hydroxy-5-phosphonooxypentane-2,3-dione isomerase